MVQSLFPIIWKDLFIENAFERRFQAVLRSAWQKRAWYVIVADPGSGKTTGISDLVRTAGSPSGTLSGRRYPILAVACPKDDEYEQTLGDYLYRALGLPLKGHWRVRKGKLMGLLVEHGVQCLVFDDAHDLSIPDLHQRIDRPGVFASVQSSAWVMPRDRWTRECDATKRYIGPARDALDPIPPPS